MYMEKYMPPTGDPTLLEPYPYPYP